MMQIQTQSQMTGRRLLLRMRCLSFLAMRVWDLMVRTVSVASAETESKMLVMNETVIFLLHPQLFPRQILERLNHKPRPELRRDASSKNSSTYTIKRFMMSV